MNNNINLTFIFSTATVICGALSFLVLTDTLNVFIPPLTAGIITTLLFFPSD